MFGVDGSLLDRSGIRLADNPFVSQSLCGVKKSTKSLAELGITFVPGDAPMADGKHIQPSDLPADFDSETAWPHCAKVIGDIRDQSNCGCCWYVLSYLYLILPNLDDKGPLVCRQGLWHCRGSF